jgi:probable HAF family extracellular repeat protein
MRSRNRRLPWVALLPVLQLLIVLTGCSGDGGGANFGGGSSGGVTTSTPCIADRVAPTEFQVDAGGLNDSGVVVGGSADGPFEWSVASGLIPLPLVSSFSNGSEYVPYAINASGDAAGWIQVTPLLRHPTAVTRSTAPGYRGVFWTPTTAVDVGDLGGGEATAWTLNDRGVVVGTSLTSSQETEAFKWTAAGGMVSLGIGSGSMALGINDSGTIVGAIQPPSANTSQGFVYADTGTITLLGPSSSVTSCVAINASGAVAGNTAPAPGGISNAFVWNAAKGTHELTTPSGAGGAKAINASGTVVGWSQSSSGAERACYWSPAGTFQDLTSVTTGLPAGLILVEAVSINASGQILATGSDGNSYLLTPKTTPAISRRR